MHSFRSLLVATAACLLAAGPSAAQTTFASITGTIADPTGTSIPNANAEATHVQSGCRYSTQSNEAGIYTQAQLRDGAYTLRVHAAGAALIETETARISDIRSDAVLKAMPRNSRNVSAFLGLTIESLRLSQATDFRP